MKLALLNHPVTQISRRLIRRAVATSAVIVAVAVVTTVSMDLGPSLRRRAEDAASAYLGRPMQIGRLSVHLWRGRYVLEDVVIDGLTPESRPFLTARRIDVSMPWSTLLTRRVVFDAIDMTDWRIYVETFPDGRHNFPRFTRERRGPSAWTTTLAYVRAHRGEFTYEDHGTPWSVVTRNLEVIVSKPTSEYRGQARFSNGTVAIQNYVPMRADMSTIFRIVDGKVVLERIDLTTDGSRSQLTGEVDFTRWPEQLYQVRSRVDFPRMRDIFFARDSFTVDGEGEFTGTFHLFREMVNGRPRTGRELKGTFSTAKTVVNGYPFADVRGALQWVPERFEVTEASARMYGGTARFKYQIAPLGERGRPAKATFDTTYENVDLTALTHFLELDGIRLASRASGRNYLEWPLGRFREHRGDGEMRLNAPVETVTRFLTAGQMADAERRGREWGPSLNRPLDGPVPLDGAVIYAYGPEWVDFGTSHLATPDTFVEFAGRTAYGERSRIEFHVTSADWQESDRVFAGVLTAVGVRTGVIPIGGYGTFDGVMVNSFRRPRIEGLFRGERMRAFDVVWGSITGRAVIENAYVDVASVAVSDGDSTMHVDGRFSLGFPRRDGGEEMNARVRLIRRPVAHLRHAFGLDEYDLDGLLSGEFHVFGPYRRPFGFGQMSLVDGLAYGESFETAMAGVRLEGEGIRLDSLQVVKGGGRATGAAYVGLNGTYSFNLDGRVPIESLSGASRAMPQLSGRLDFSGGGSGTFDRPRYDVRGTISDFFVGDEGIGQVVGELSVSGELMTLKLEAASPRLTLSGSGRVALTPEMDADLTFIVADTSLDPYVRELNPRLSPYTTAIASGNVRVVGKLANVDELLVDAMVDRLDLRMFDYRLRNAAPIRVALDRHTMRIEEMRLVGEETQLDISGTVNLHDERIAMRATGDAGLGLLQGFDADIRSSGRAVLAATLEGPMRDPLVTGTMTVENGRIRHFALPHALENISGPVRFDTRSVRLDEMTARLGGGLLRFGGRIEMERYQPTRVDVTLSGESMRLRFPEGMRSVVDASLSLQGMVDALALSGVVTVRNAVYTRQFDDQGGLIDLTTGPTQSGDPGGGTIAPARLPLRYDVRIVAPSTLEIRNSVARVFANADLQLRGTYERPLVFGRAEVDRGEFTFEGRRYQITRGTIDFNNPTRIQPFFDIETETRVRVPGQTYRVVARAAGTLDRLTPTFEADPPLPEVEVLSLLFGDVAPGQDVEFRQYSTNITPQQQLLRERATRALTGAFSSEVGRLAEQTFGVDTFQLTPSLVDPNAQSSRLDPAARLTIGKRLSERIYLTYSRSLSSSTRDQIILLEYDQTDRFSWILSRNEDRTYALDVRVRHAF